MTQQVQQGSRRPPGGGAGMAGSDSPGAILLLLAAMTLAPLGDALSKQLALTMAPSSIVVLRYLCGGCLALPVAWLRGERLWPDRAEWPGLILSTALVMGAMALLVAALARAPLADVAGAFMTAPLVAMLLTAGLRRRAPAPRQVLGAVLGLGPVGLAFFLWDMGMKRGDIQWLGVAAYAAPLLSTLLLVATGVTPATSRLALAALLITAGALIAGQAGRRGRRE